MPIIQLDIALIITNYTFLFYSAQYVSFLVGLMIAGFYSANVLIGNHERETRIEGRLDKSTFMDHQISTCRNYQTKGFCWLMLMGGMQYQTEHHLFPQIPFYRLPEA
jgi:fatty acid desaturase